MNDKKYDLLCIGTALVDSIIRGFDSVPISASGFVAQSASLHVGGEAVNEAITASRLGLRTAIFASVGEDGAGAMVLSALRENGVDTGLLIRSQEHPTPITTMFVNADGTRKSITNGAHRYGFHPERFAQQIHCTKAISLGSLFRAPFHDPTVLRGVLDAAKQAGATVYADTKLPNFTRLTLEDLRDSLPDVDYIFPNEDEARYYSGRTEPEEMADVFLSYGIKHVVIKLGAKGCLFKSRTQTLYSPAYPISAVDATGAGDSFLAGFASRIQLGEPVENALRFANACGALCTSCVGAVGGIQSRAQVEAWILGTATP